MPDDWDAPFTIRLRIIDADGAELFAGETSTAKHEAHAARARRVGRARQPGAAGLGAADRAQGSCRRDEYTLEPGHVVEIEIDGIGILVNIVA